MLGFDLSGRGRWINSVYVFIPLGICPIPITLAELKLQGIKICNVVVFSRYSRAKSFASCCGLQIKWLYSSVVERWTSNPQITDSNPSGGNHLIQLFLSFIGDVFRQQVPVGIKFYWVLMFSDFGSREFCKH